MSIENDALDRGDQGCDRIFAPELYSKSVRFYGGGETVVPIHKEQWTEIGHIGVSKVEDFSTVVLPNGMKVYGGASEHVRLRVLDRPDADKRTEEVVKALWSRVVDETNSKPVTESQSVTKKSPDLAAEESAESGAGGDGDNVSFEKVAPVSKRAVQRVPGSRTFSVLQHLGLKKHMMRELEGDWGDALDEYFSVLKTLDKPGNKSRERAMRINIPLNMVRTVFGTVVTWFLREILGQYKGTK